LSERPSAADSPPIPPPAITIFGSAIVLIRYTAPCCPGPGPTDGKMERVTGIEPATFSLGS
jgi:hypothetical protein